MATLKIPKDVILLPQDRNRWVIYNLFTRTCVGVEGSAIEFLGKVDGLGEESPKIQDTTARYCVWEVGYFSHAEGLLCDPTRFIRDSSRWPGCLEVGARELIQIFKDKSLIITDEVAYRARFQPKDSVLDRFHKGNFHQQLGMYLLKGRETPSAFWYGQKFTEC